MSILATNKSSYSNTSSNSESAKAADRYRQICGIIETLGTPMDPLDFLQRLYHGTNERLTYILSNERVIRKNNDGTSYEKIGTYRSCRDDEELLQLSRFRNDVYVPPQTFYHGRFEGKMVRNHHAIVIDLDNLTPEMCQYLLKLSSAGKIPRPSMITASGGGLHFYYHFSVPYEGYKYRYEALLEWKRILTQKLSKTNQGKVDMLSVIQAHRLPGSNTKKGQQVCVFNTGPSFLVEDLVNQIGGSMPKKDFSTFKPKSEASKPVAETVKKPNKVLYIPNGKAGFWNYSHMRLFRERAREGNRERALFALAIVGYKCRIPSEEVLEVLTLLRGIFNQEASSIGGSPVDQADIDKAMNGYQQKYVRTRGEKLAEFFDWSWGENHTLRNGRSRKDHLAWVAEAKKGRSAAAVFNWRQANPGGGKRECSRALSMSPKTVLKFWD